MLDRMLEGETDGLRGIAGALQDASARWAQLRQAAAAGEVDGGMDATADLVAALRTIAEARRQGATVQRMLAQNDLDRPPLTDTGRAFLAAMFSEPGFAGRPVRREVLAERLDGYVTEAMKARPGPDLFGAPPLSPRQVFEQERLAAMPDAPPTAAADAPPAEAPVFRFEDPPPAAAAPPIDPEAARRQSILVAADGALINAHLAVSAPCVCRLDACSRGGCRPNAACAPAAGGAVLCAGLRALVGGRTRART